MRIPESIAGQGLSPFAYYRRAKETLFNPDVSYLPKETHQEVANHLIEGGDVFVAQDAVSGTIRLSQEAMPDVFAYPNITAYGGVVLSVEFEGFHHIDIHEEDLEVAIAFDPVARQCMSTIEKRGLFYAASDRIKDTADAAELLRNNGRFLGKPALAICTKEAGEYFNLVSTGVMSDIPGATRFIAYNNKGEYDSDGNRQLIAIRVPHEPDALRRAIVAGFKGVNLTGGVQLNVPENHDYADFSFEFEGTPEDAQRVVEKLSTPESTTLAQRHLGSLTLIDTRTDLARHGKFDHTALATQEPGLVSVYISMSDTDLGMAHELERLTGGDKPVNISRLRIPDEPEANFRRGLVLDFTPDQLQLALPLLNGNAQVLNKHIPTEMAHS